MNITRLLTATLAALCLTSACTNQGPRIPEGSPLQGRALENLGQPIPHAPNERFLTILATNDIHGGLDADLDRKSGRKVGGLPLFAGVASAIREGVKAEYGQDGGVLVLDGGDQFQGTLLSNYNEGSLLIEAMGEAGYDAVVPGNHDYDFGPLGWLEDKVTAQSPDQNPRGVIEKLSREARFPFLSANTYFKSSLVDLAGNPVKVKGEGCVYDNGKDEPASSEPDPNAPQILWPKAKRPAFIQPYVIRQVAGIRVALIGIDNPETPTMTTVENVSDLCFRDELETYVEIRNQLEGAADVFVMVLHNGDAGKDKGMSELLRKLAAMPGNMIDALVAGHTHMVNEVREQGIPAIQSGSGGAMFGRIDLVFDTDSRRVDRARTRSFAGLRLFHDGCDEKARAFCEALPGGKLRYEGMPATPSAGITKAIAAEQERVKPLTGRVLGEALEPIKRDRISESPLANIMTDAFRALSSAEIAFLNTGGIREDLPKGTLTYERLFRVFPFNNRGLVLGPMEWAKVRALLEKSIQTCGAYGALMQSGLKVEFSRDCTRAAENKGLDKNAKLERVATVAGELLLDAATGEEPGKGRQFRVATLDFLASGGSGYEGFKEVPVLADLGILRELLTDELIARPGRWSATLDGRWKNRLPEVPPRAAETPPAAETQRPSAGG